MEIPLAFKKSADGRLSYGIPLWYRLMTAAMILLVGGGIFITGDPPSLIAWIILALLVLGTLYEERWVADPRAKEIRHIGGIWPFARATAVAFGDIEDFHLEAFARGTVPGSNEEAVDQEKAFAAMNGTAKEEMSRPSLLKSGRRKPYIQLLLETRDGESYLVDTLPARSAARLKKVGEALAAACESNFSARESGGDVNP